FAIFIWIICLFTLRSFSQEGVIPAFEIESTLIDLHRLAQPGMPFNRVGQKFALLGYENGTLEAWGYPVKLLRNFEMSFLIGSSTRPISAGDIVRYIDVTPTATTLTFTYQSFTVKAHYIAAIDQPCAMILLHVDSTEPLTIVCGFLPVLQPMWPAGIGGQYAYWKDDLKCYVISEPTRQNHGFIGSPAASGISYTPAHMLSDVPNEFKIVITDPDSIRNQYIPIYLTGGKGSRDSLQAVYRNLAKNPQRIYDDVKTHYNLLQNNTLQINTPDPALNLAYEWCKTSLDQLVVQNSDLGKGLVAGLAASGSSGRPGFGWFFGGDAYINSLAMNSMGAVQTVRDALIFTQKWQRKDGKMAHELSQAAGYIDWFGKYPYGYIHGDTTPFYIVALHDYFRASGDTALVRDSYSSLLKAYKWCLATDENGDSLMDNPKAGLGSVEYGALTDLRTDIFIGALSVRMSHCMNELALVVGDGKTARMALKHYLKSVQVFDEKFWDAETGIYSNAFNDLNEHIQEISPWIGFATVIDVGDSAHSLQSLYRLGSAELTTDWGFRSISNKSKYFGALNYNYGAVWPFLSGFVTLAQFKYQLSQQGYTNLLAIADHVFDHSLGAITEVFSGKQNIWPQEAVSQQGFSSTGLVLPLLRGLLGITINVPKREITFSPQVPADWEVMTISNCRGGNATFAFDYQKSPSHQLTFTTKSKNAAGYRAIIAPSFSIGTKISQVTVDGKPWPYSLETFTQTTRPRIVLTVTSERHQIVITYRPGVEILPLINRSRTGDRNKGLKIISMQHKLSNLTIQLQGLCDQIYLLRLKDGSMINYVEGGTLKGNTIEIEMPDACESDYVDHKLTIHIKQ
ncbi:hypothetical protein JXO59_07640, partial [candidate division KSB1 bacterium]|nr:hypothetical protein [candidate division KSB1 bacterium]